MGIGTIIVIFMFIFFGFFGVYAYGGAVLEEKREGMIVTALFFTSLFILAGYILGYGIWRENKPQAIDVYRNKTTLKVTYVDSVATDSVVIFKKK